MTANRPEARILTLTGSIDLLNPDPKDIHIEDIAHALSRICRYGGHCREFYSVAQHSWHVSHLVSQENALLGLLHDAAEAYIGDVVKPLKMLLPDYRLVEQRIEAAVFERFELEMTQEDKREVKLADEVLLRTELRDVMDIRDQRNLRAWALPTYVQPMDKTLVPLPPERARGLFLQRYEQLIEVAGKQKLVDREPYPAWASCRLEGGEEAEFVRERMR